MIRDVLQICSREKERGEECVQGVAVRRRILGREQGSALPLITRWQSGEREKERGGGGKYFSGV